jgi:hypothetical protein
MSIKINRTKGLSKLSPTIERAVWQSINPELIKELSSKQLALVAQSMDKLWSISTNYIEQEIVNEGCVWAKKYGQVLDIELPKKTIVE